MTISPEAKEAAELELHAPQPAGYFIQQAINSATAPLHKEIERLRGEVEKAHAEGWMHRDKYNYRDHDTIYKAYSRAKRVAEGKE